MSGYRNEWPCCGDETYTQAWEPVRCPFCELGEAKEKLEQAEARAAELEDALVWSLGKLSIEVPVSAGNISYLRAFEKADSALRKSSSGAWLLRKQAEAIDRMSMQWMSEAKDLPLGAEHRGRGASIFNWQSNYSKLAMRYAQRLRQQADDIERQSVGGGSK